MAWAFRWTGQGNLCDGLSARSWGEHGVSVGSLSGFMEARTRLARALRWKCDAMHAPWIRRFGGQDMNLSDEKEQKLPLAGRAVQVVTLAYCSFHAWGSAAHVACTCARPVLAYAPYSYERL